MVLTPIVAVDAIRRGPSRISGFGRVAWIMPFAALLAGMAGLVWLVRSWRSRPAPAIADGIQPVQGPELERYREQADKETDL